MNSQSPIGFFDSGIGGLSVLRAARQALPFEHCVYYGDTKNAPYGVRPQQEILRLARAGAQRLMKEGVKALVIACNTATGAALGALQAELPIPVIGIQPALEAAQALRKGGHILALATPAALESARYKALRKRYGEGVIDLPAPGLMEFVEREELSGERLENALRRLFSPCLNMPIDVIALGCTHFPFLKAEIARFFPDVPMIDDSPRVCRELSEALAEKNLLNPGPGAGSLRLYSSGGAQAEERLRRLALGGE